jgi:L-alanine-DL-glutamate epimerase-like enolase superfamily enzyme
VEGAAAAIEALRPRLEAGLDRSGLQAALPPGAARNALDCAFWDLEAKATGRSAAELAGLPPLKPLVTAYTISIGTPEEMAQAAEREAQRPLLKVKLGRDGDPARIAAVRRAAPGATLIVDANEGWDERHLEANLAACAEAGVTLVEQPLPDGRDGALARIARPIAVCADESAHARNSLAALAGRYDAVNVKLDKAGGLTEALAMAAEAERLGLKLMVGCMVATSLSMAPAVLVAQRADIVDLDGPLLLTRDRPDPLNYAGSRVDPPSPALWG